MKRFFLIGLLFLMSSALISFVLPPKWVSLGSKKVDFQVEKDVLPVTYREGAFSAIKLEVSDGALNMHRCIIHFENKTSQEVELRHNFGKGSESRVIDLKGNKRFIESIEFWYDSKNVQMRKATITVWGRK